MNTTRRVLVLAAAAATALATTAGAHAQDYPSRPIKWIVPYLAGTAPDTTVRITGDAMSKILGQPVVIENRGGVAGNIGAQLAAKAPADGYTWVYSGSPMATNMRMYRKPGFDVMKDFIHVGRITQSDSVIVVNPDSGITSVKQLVEHLRKSPGKMAYASGGVGTPSHMGAELLLAATGTKALHVPYKGASESTNAVAGKQVDFALALVAPALPHIQGGKLVPLAVLSPERNARLDKVPTLAEAGVPGISLVSFGGLALPKGAPAPVVQKVRDALAQALAAPEVREKLEANGAAVVPSTPEQFAQSLQAEIALTEKLMKVANIEAQ
ncbi:Bug family tripartite tricarboxylate transporter substrate binding protein [Variovorax sp. RA8]|uniref:Bug family tripartite tricarboxylate transporter substrate binding protein n=1 Tax=Variovorax sp. (strain JCM 16519 / RA8) TaxID=662548 RepID=UPI00131988D1|nr:tripartite tricarboxylate transporter substrate binding protein [Variovorax sp. RA8]VTU39020.1 Argininosuccinate lyase [Variovorax sp. RA8]